MTLGISIIRNSLGEVVIDQNYVALEVIQEGVLTSPGGGYDNLIALDYSNVLRPMVFVQLAVDVRYFFGPTTSTRFWMSSNASAGVNIPYKLCGFRIPANSNPGGLGIRVNRTGSDDIAFHSRRKYLTLIDSLQVGDGETSAILRAGDSRDFATNANGTIIWEQYNHPTKPIALGTYWLATMTGLFNRLNSVNSDAWVIERKSTTRYEVRADPIINRPQRLTMGLPDPTGVTAWITRLIAV